MSDWIFLRGLMREQRHWGSFVREFEARLPAAKAYPVDLPGNGELNYLRSPTTVKEMVEACRSQVQEQGLAPPYRFVAVSMGAMVAVQWATTYPEEVGAMVLVNTSMRPFSAFYQRLRPQNYASIFGLTLSRASSGRWEKAILRMTTHHPRDDVLASWQSLRERTPVSRWNALRQLWAAARFRAPLQKPLPSVLLLASAQDQLVSAACSEAIAKQWDVPLRVHPSAGHDLTLDDGPWVATQMLCWLESEASLL
jgi:pimeloyl-ACP methyl ester carboxylesterase